MRVSQQTRRLGVGKLDPKVLVRLVLAKLGKRDPDVVLGPTLGEDAAIIRIGGEFIAIHTDPVTGASSRIGWISVIVCTNDIFSKGFKPKFLSVALILPRGTTRSDLSSIASDMEKAALHVGASIVGGHTEISRQIDTPIIVSTAVGVTPTGRYVTSSGAHAGDYIVVTKGAAIEGTAIIASDLSFLLKGRVPRRVQSRARKFMDELSISREALAAMSVGGVTAMHDVTEGGVLCAIQEVAAASRCGFNIQSEKIQVRSETEVICRALSIDPLRTIGSGSLVITIDRAHVSALLDALRLEKVDASIAGKMTRASDGQVLTRKGKNVRLTRFIREELWRVLR